MELTTCTTDRGTCPSRRSILETWGIQSLQELLQQSTTRTQRSVWHRGTTEYYCTHRQDHQVDQQRHRPYGLQRFLRVGTFPLTLTEWWGRPRSVVPPHRRSTRHHHHMFLVATSWHWSSRSQDERRLAASHVHSQHHILYPSDPKEWHHRYVRQQRTQLCLRTQSHQSSMSTLRHGQTRETCPLPFPKIRHSTVHTRAGWLTPVEGQHHPDLSPSHSVYRHTTSSTRTRWHPSEQILWTCMQSIRSPIPHKTRIQHWGSSVDRQMGLRRHQEVHTRLTIDETATHIADQDRRSHQTIGTGPNDKILQSILDHTQLLGDHTHTCHSRDLHRQ